MSGQIIDFIKACQGNEGLLKDLVSGDKGQIAKIAEKLGFKIDVNELLEFVRGKRPAGELSDNELTAVAGGMQDTGISGGYVCSGLSKGLSCWGC